MIANRHNNASCHGPNHYSTRPMIKGFQKQSTPQNFSKLVCRYMGGWMPSHSTLVLSIPAAVLWIQSCVIYASTQIQHSLLFPFSLRLSRGVCGAALSHSGRYNRGYLTRLPHLSHCQFPSDHKAPGRTTPQPQSPHYTTRYEYKPSSTIHHTSNILNCFQNVSPADFRAILPKLRPK